MMFDLPLQHSYIARIAARALEEDVGAGDLTADLVPDELLEAELICRQQAILAGTAFFDEVFLQLDAAVEIHWRARDGDSMGIDQTVCTISGAARGILTAERSALNLLQTLSGTATATRHYVDRVKGTRAKILDTR